MLAALEGMSSRASRSRLDGKLPEGKRGGLTIIVVSPKDEPEEMAESGGEHEMPAEPGEMDTDDEM